ncbi:Phenylalanine aminomutase L-beta-phenylalanine forming [Metarhizium brunneum]|uniref:Phenylalanine aminomutase L-beta-phenylalanine forming n=1 Tax=Metarhizium brunneum TaxID=500148 RepID=A0A7D5UX15_9HYPO
MPETLYLPKDKLGLSGEPYSMSDDLVRAIIAIRCNSLLRGHSAIRLELIKVLLQFLSKGMLPMVPLRGSISASGDLSPLSYLGGLLEGNPDIWVRYVKDGVPQLVTASAALSTLNIREIHLQPKEGLAIMNGTSVSVALAAQVVFDSNNLAVICQVITAMTAEALLGTPENYCEFISACRPHYGQTEVARNIRAFVAESSLCREGNSRGGLAQDRYALRTASQWIGPLVEDLQAATSQIQTELNSTTDNPLIDSEQSRVYHGGNFQAVSVTSAMEKTRTALVMLGRLLLAQSNELVNPYLSHGLSPNLVADNPSTSFTGKAVDINMTAYFCELAFFANSVASHVQTAEMNNQSVNSLGLIAARMTQKSNDLVSMMAASIMFLLCQALDLRARDMDFFLKARPVLLGLFHARCSAVITSECTQNQNLDTLFDALWASIQKIWAMNSRLDIQERCKQTIIHAADDLLNRDEYISVWNCNISLVTSLHYWKSEAAILFHSRFLDVDAEFCKCQSTSRYLAPFTSKIYQFIRNDLCVPFHLGFSDHPSIAQQRDGGSKPTRTIGFSVTKIFSAVQDGTLSSRIQVAMPVPISPAST